MPPDPIADETAVPGFAGKIILVPVDQVAIGPRLRQIDEVWACALGGVMAREGQQTPIEVCRIPGRPGWELVAGAHRLTGARHVGMELIEAREVSSSADFRKMREASENIWRRGLDPIGRAAHVAELVRLHKLRAGVDPDKVGRATSADVRWQKAVNKEADDATATIAVAYGWDAAVADELGFSGRTIRNDLMLYRRLVPGVIADLRAAKHAILDNSTQLKALAKLDEGKQQRVALRLTMHGAKSVAEAVAQLGGGKPLRDPEAKRLSAFAGAFHRMSLAEKKGAVAHIKEMLPAGSSLGEATGPSVPTDVADALNATFNLFLEIEKWDAASPMGLLAQEIHETRSKVQLALFTVNAARPAK